MTKSKYLGTLLVLAMAAAFTANAAAQGAASTTTGPQETTSEETTSPGSVVTEGGNVTNINVSRTSSSEYWTGFYGQVDGTKVLGAGSDRFFQWTIQDPSGSYVYAVPTASNDVSSLSTVTDGNENSVTGIGSTAGVENASNTFNTTATFNGAGLSSSTKAVDTQSDSGSFTTFLLKDTSATAPNPVYASEALNNEAGFDSNLYDYQLLAGDQGGDGETYEFYLELS